MGSYCRICLEEEDLLKNINDSIIDCIKNEIPFEINDEFSQEICGECHKVILEKIELDKKVKEFYERFQKFKENAIKKQKLLQKIVKRKDSTVSVDVLSDYNANTVTTSSADTNVILNSNSNDLISKVIKSINLDEVEKAAQKPKMMNNYCNICKIKIPDFQKFQKHAECEPHRLKSCIVEKFGKLDIFSTHVLGYRCRTCKKTFTSKTAVASHSNKDNPQSCTKNNWEPIAVSKIKKNNDTRKYSEESHLSEVKVEDGQDNASENVNPINPINGYKLHPCKYCSNKSFRFIESLQRHMQKQHKEVLFCSRCEFTTTKKKSLADHLRKEFKLTHIQRICSCCFKIFNSQTDLLSHRKNYHNTKMLQICSICNMSFANSALLKTHKRNVHRIISKRLKLCSSAKNCSIPKRKHLKNCLLKTSASSIQKSKKSQISRVKELPKKIGGRESAGLKRRNEDSAENLTSKKTKISPEDFVRRSSYDSVKPNVLPSVFELKKKLTKAEENSKTPTESISIGDSRDSKKEENCIACKECGLLFKNVIFLSQHFLAVHSVSVPVDTIGLTSELVTRRTENINNIQRSESDYRVGPSETSCDNATQNWELKWKQTSLPTNEKTERSPSLVEIPRPMNCSTVSSSQTTKINEAYERIPEQSLLMLGESKTIQKVKNDNPSSTPKKNNQSSVTEKSANYQSEPFSTPVKSDQFVDQSAVIQGTLHPKKTYSTPKEVDIFSPCVIYLPKKSSNPKRKNHSNDRSSEIRGSSNNTNNLHSTSKKNHRIGDESARIRAPVSHLHRESTSRKNGNSLNHVKSLHSIPKKNDRISDRSAEFRESARHLHKESSTLKKNDHTNNDQSGKIGRSLNHTENSYSTPKKNGHISDRLVKIRGDANCPSKSYTTPTKNDRIVDQSSEIQNSVVDYFTLPSSATPPSKYTVMSCRVCRKTEMHQFCNQCYLCFQQDKVRYEIHEKKKHGHSRMI